MSDRQSKAVYTLSRTMEMLREARMTVTGTTAIPVADALKDLEELYNKLRGFEWLIVDQTEAEPEGVEDDVDTN